MGFTGWRWGLDPNLLTQQSSLAEALGGQRLVFDNLNQGKTKTQRNSGKDNKVYSF